MKDPAERKLPVIELFGPTVQGEGLEQGVPCHFVRFGGCDYRCDWCDTPHAVLPKEVAANKSMMRPDEIDRALEELPRVPWIILSGGNPAMLQLGHLVDLLHARGFRVAIETQGTLWKPWLDEVDRICLSFKPPSSGQTFLPREAAAFLWKVGDLAKVFVKLVVFDDTDFEWAGEVLDEIQGRAPVMLSAGNDAGRTVGNPDREDPRTGEEIKLDLLGQSRWLTDKVLEDPVMRSAGIRVQSQYHVLMWANELGR